MSADLTVSGDLGHTAVSTTTSIYCHMFQEAQARTSDVIENALNFTKKKKDDQTGEDRKAVPA